MFGERVRLGVGGLVCGDYLSLKPACLFVAHQGLKQIWELYPCLVQTFHVGKSRYSAVNMLVFDQRQQETKPNVF